jgi:hypothetical protein
MPANGAGEEQGRRVRFVRARDRVKEAQAACRRAAVALAVIEDSDRADIFATVRVDSLEDLQAVRYALERALADHPSGVDLVVMTSDPRTGRQGHRQGGTP